MGTSGGGGREAAAAGLQVEDIWYAYEAGVAALRGVTLKIDPGERVALIGRNGSGKTTLARHANGLLRPQRGRVLVGGLDTRRHDVSRLAGIVGYVFQNPDHQLFSRSVREELAFGPRNLGLAAAEVERRVEETMHQVGLTALAHAPPAVLGLAQRRLVALASVIAMRPSILVVDEPFAGLSWPAIQRLEAILLQLATAGHAVVFITHQMRAVAALATRCIVLDGGRVLADRPVRETLGDGALLAAAALVAPAIVRLGERLRPQGFSGRAVHVDELVDEYRRLRGQQGRRGRGAPEPGAAG